MDLDGTHPRRLTHEVGYDGGAFFSPRQQADRLSCPASRQSGGIGSVQGAVGAKPGGAGRLEIFIMNADGSGKQQVTTNGASNFSPTSILMAIASSSRRMSTPATRAGDRSFTCISSTRMVRGWNA